MTPLSLAMDDYVQKNRARFHVPGHKGALPWFGTSARYDITEVGGCDELYLPRSAIADTEARYARLYKSDASLLCAGGSTLCIQTMLALAVKPGGKLVCGRGCHTSAINAMALLDLEPCWVFPETDKATGLSEAVTAAQISEVLSENPDASAVYITSPDYYGVIADVPAISGVCREFSVPILVDNAHGAYLRFLEPSLHPINLGADMCNDSLHKTLPALTGSAMLHIKNKKYIPDAKRFMSIFASTSPSYLVMLSIDKALEVLAGDFRGRLQDAVAWVARLERLARDKGFLIPKAARDPLRLTLGFGALGYKPDEFLGLMRQSDIEPEMCAESFCVLMASPSNTAGDYVRLEDFIAALPAKKKPPVDLPVMIKPKKVKRLREAVFASCVEVPLGSSLGRICGSIVAPCPPGIPLVIPGEAIDQNLMLYLKKYGILRLNVVE